MVPMIGIGVYPKMVTQIYESRTDMVVTHFNKNTTNTVPTLWS
jgi:NADH:ubiquinone oxidoreductase subunit 4 (subunit M)